MKKLLILAASLALIITLSLTGTIAYRAVKEPETAVSADLMAAEPAEPTQPPAYIEIKQEIWQRMDKNNPSTDAGNLEPYSKEADQMLLPSPGFNRADGRVSAPVAGGECWGAEAAGGLDRVVTVTNTSIAQQGGVAAYVRTVFAMENPNSMVDELVYLNYNADESAGTWEKIGNAKIDGTDFMLFCFTYKDPLQPGETAPPSLKQFVLDASTTNEDVALLGAEYELHIFSQAVAAVEFASVEDAFGRITTKNHPWSMAAEPGRLVAVSE